MDRFVELVRDLQVKLECPSCHLSYRNPKVSTRCTHTACHECFINLVCPVCQVPTSESALKDETKIRDVISIFKTLRAHLPDGSNAENVPNSESSVARSSASKNSPAEPLAAVQSPHVGARKARPSSIQGSASKVEKKNRHGETPLHVACKKKGNIDRVRELLAQGADPNTQDHAGWSPLHEVAQTGDLEVAEALLSNGANINIMACCQTTPLHDAVSIGFADMIKLFLEHGADPKLKNSEGKIALELANYNPSIRKIVESVKPVAEKIAAATSVTAAGKFLVMSSSLKEVQSEKLNEFLKLVNAEWTAHYRPEVTHLIVNADPKGDTQRTLKFLQCLASGKAIVSYQWIEECLRKGKLQSELPFEVKGCRQFSGLKAPRRAREAAAAAQPGLLNGFQVYFASLDRPYVPSAENLVQLTELAGGIVLKRHPKTLSDEEKQQQFVSSPYVASNSTLRKHKFLVVGLESKISQGILYVTRDWLIDSISNFELLMPHL